jgi:hypothetical protein
LGDSREDGFEFVDQPIALRRQRANSEPRPESRTGELTGDDGKLKHCAFASAGLGRLDFSDVRKLELVPAVRKNANIDVLRKIKIVDVKSGVKSETIFHRLSPYYCWF